MTLLLPAVASGPPTLDYVHHCDNRTGCAALPDNSVDLIFTDPPYSRANIIDYAWLAQMAARVLRPGGFCLAMAGGLYQDEIMVAMSAHLKFYWTFHVYLSGQNTGAVHPGGNHAPIITRVKPIYAYVKGWGSPRTVMSDPFSGDGNDKRFHAWGQDQKSARYYVDCMSKSGEIVLDPFCGGGTTPVVCKALDRRYIAFDNDPVSVKTTRARLRNPLFMPARADQMIMEFAQ